MLYLFRSSNKSLEGLRDPNFNAGLGLDLVSRLFRQSNVGAIFMQEGSGIPQMM